MVKFIVTNISQNLIFEFSFSLIYFCFMKFTLLTIIKQNIKIIKSKINIF